MRKIARALARLTAKRRKRERQRDRQVTKWQKTRKRGHARAAKRHAKAVRFLRRRIRRRLDQRDRLQRQRVITREEWGAEPPRGGYVRQPQQVIAGIQHHDAYPALPATATVAEECAHMRRIQQGHFARGFSDIGYMAVAFPSGRIYEGRPAWAVGAQTLGHNTGYRGWCANGNYESDRPTPELLDACHRIREMAGAAAKPLFGHFELNPTACPGAHLKPHLRKEI